MMFDYTKRRIFNDILKEEIVRDFYGLDIKSILDIGCGDCYLLNLLKKHYGSNNISLYCIEEIDIYEFCSCKGVVRINISDVYLYKFDVVTLVDVIYLINKQNLVYLFNNLKYSMSDHGVIYIVLGIYKESRWRELFGAELIGKYNVYIYSLDELVDIFSKHGYKVFIKKLIQPEIFGIRVDTLQNSAKIKKFIDYLYDDKLLIKCVT